MFYSPNSKSVRFLWNLKFQQMIWRQINTTSRNRKIMGVRQSVSTRKKVPMVDSPTQNSSHYLTLSLTHAKPRNRRLKIRFPSQISFQVNQLECHNVGILMPSFFFFLLIWGGKRKHGEVYGRAQGGEINFMYSLSLFIVLYRLNFHNCLIATICGASSSYPLSWNFRFCTNLIQ